MPRNFIILIVSVIILLGLAGAGLWLNQAYFFGGWFTREFSQEQEKNLQRELEQRFGVTAGIMESFPEQFRIPSEGGISLNLCQSIREFLQTKPYIQTVGKCRKRPFPLFFNPEQTVKSPPLKTLDVFDEGSY